MPCVVLSRIYWRASKRADGAAYYWHANAQGGDGALEWGFDRPDHPFLRKPQPHAASHSSPCLTKWNYSYRIDYL
jgi:hypothetical protein